MQEPNDADAATDSLDALQRRFAGSPDGSRGVLLGAAGSGKTAAVIARVARIARIDPDSVLALTPTRASAAGMRDILGLRAAVATGGPLARSLASFAYGVVREHAARAGDAPPRLLTGADEDHLIADLLAGDAEDERAGRPRWPEDIPAPVRATRRFRDELRAVLSDCTALGIGPGDLRALAVSRGRPEWATVASFADEYNDVVARMRPGFGSAAAILARATAVLRRPGPSALPRGLRAVVVDDLQDMPAGSLALLQALADRGVGVLATAGPDVASGSFRGVRPRAVTALAARWGIVGVLRGRYRGTPMQHELYDTTVSMIGTAGIADHRRAPRAAAPDGSVAAFVLREPAQEYDLIARILRERHLRHGVPWAQCAVIAHDARQVLMLERELAAREVPARAAGTTAPLGTYPAVQDVVGVVLYALDAASGIEPARLLAAAGVDAIAQRRLRWALAPAGAGAAAGDPLATALEEPDRLPIGHDDPRRRVGSLARAVAALRRQHADGAGAEELLWTAWTALGRGEDRVRRSRDRGPLAWAAGRELDAVVALFDAARRRDEHEPAGDPLAFLRTVLRADVSEDRLGGAGDPAAVPVLTPAAAAGREADTVVIAGVQEGVWPNSRPRGGTLGGWMLGSDEEGTSDRRRDAEHDELRLFALAISRARARIVVTAVDDEDMRPSPLFALLPDPLPVPDEHPMTLRGLVAHHRRTLTEPDRSLQERDHAAAQLALLADAGVPGADPAEWFGCRGRTSADTVHDARSGPVRVSPSRIRALEECELNWVIGRLGGAEPRVSAGVGDLVHAALAASPTADEDALWAAVDARWHEVRSESEWRDRARRRQAREMVRRLARYLRDARSAGGELVAAEAPFEVRISLPGGSDALISGVVDRVERDSAGAAVIVDVKTGRHEPHTDMKVADHVQLTAYQYAHDRGAIRASAGMPGAGAALLLLQPPTRADYLAPRQAPLDDDRRVEFEGRAAHAAAVMSGDAFRAPYEEHCQDVHGHGDCRIHTIPAVSAP